MADAPDFRQVDEQGLAALTGKMMVVRLAVTPLIATFACVAIWLDPAPWRLAIGGTAIGALVVIAVFEHARFRMGRSGPWTIPLNVVAMAWVQIALVAATGGLASPLLPALPIIGLQAGLLGGRVWLLIGVVLAQWVAIWTFATLSAGHSLAIPGFGPSDPSGPWRWYVAVPMTLMSTGAAAFALVIHRLVRDTVSRAFAAHEQERRAHEDHAREMVAFAGEIAHELKNPLAAVKGLGSLLARDLQGKEAERLAVLRGEVERMEETLAGFLDFSRPVAPLAHAPFDAADLAQEVAQVCEGLARSAGVRVEVSAAPVTVSADRRKLRQILVNLVQNAIEASPAGAAVEVSAGRSRGTLEIAVLDRGAGIPAMLPIFEPGMTSKPAGNGLGLTIARALVSQHGGSLSLEARDGGGTRAVVGLP